MRTLWQTQPDPAVINREEAKNHVQRHNLAGFRTPKLGTVRVGVIGLGSATSTGAHPSLSPFSPPQA